MSVLHRDKSTVVIISRSFIFEMINIADKRFRENQNTHFICDKFLFRNSCPVCEITWKNIAEPDRPQMTIWRARALHAE